MKERSNLQTLVNKHSLELSSLVATPPTGDSVKSAEGWSVKKVVEKKQKVYSIELGEAGGGGAAVRTLVNTEVKTEQERSEVKQESGEVREAVGSVLSELSSRCRLIMTFSSNPNTYPTYCLNLQRFGGNMPLLLVYSCFLPQFRIRS